MSEQRREESAWALVYLASALAMLAVIVAYARPI